MQLTEIRVIIIKLLKLHRKFLIISRTFNYVERVS